MKYQIQELELTSHSIRRLKKRTNYIEPKQFFKEELSDCLVKHTKKEIRIITKSNYELVLIPNHSSYLLLTVYSNPHYASCNIIHTYGQKCLSQIRIKTPKEGN